MILRGVGVAMALETPMLGHPRGTRGREGLPTLHLRTAWDARALAWEQYLLYYYNMVTANKIEIKFRQQNMSCVIASYAIVANYFADTLMQDVFTGYCDHFRLEYRDVIEAEIVSAVHLNQECPRKNWQGYKMVKELHENSNQPVFKKNREAFIILKQVGGTPNEEERQELINDIKDNDSLINILIMTPDGKAAHSQTVGIAKENGKEFLRDTGGPNNLIYSDSTFVNHTIKEYLVFTRSR